MNYQKHYEKLMNRAPKLFWVGEKNKCVTWERRDGVYREGHRILPGCMGGKYIANNVAYLLPEEHYVAHQLLIKMYPEQVGLISAAHMMTVSKSGQVRNHRKFGWLRRKMVEHMSAMRKGRKSPAVASSNRRRGGRPAIRTAQHESNLKESVIQSHIYNWQITTPSGEIIVIQNLSKYCRQHNIDRMSTKLGYMGYKAIKLDKVMP